MSEVLQIAIDLNRCVGSTMCVQFASGVFALDVNGQGSLIDEGGASRDEIVDAASQCPMEAISVVDTATGENLFPGD